MRGGWRWRWRSLNTDVQVHCWLCCPLASCNPREAPCRYAFDCQDGYQGYQHHCQCHKIFCYTSTHVNLFSHLMNSLNLKTAIRVMFVGQTTIRLLKNLKMICGRSVVESIRAKTKNTHIFWSIEFFSKFRYYKFFTGSKSLKVAVVLK